uniref:Gp15 family bacteriophage protein n=1 Tax=Ndongobacter massiliensis TaxID=1871025 RepID=UPI0009F8115C|nr:Gp15 family bacteriophage protein [Ndongobacter massiliensis]
MLSLHKKEETKIDIDGVIFTINSSFDVILRLIDLLQDDRFSPSERVVIGLKMLISDTLSGYSIQDRNEILKSILSEYVRVEEDVALDILGNPMPKEKEELFFSFEQDAELIYAAFMQTYGIDLIEMQGKLPWTRFQALLNGLPENTRFSQVVAIRKWKPGDDKKSKAQAMQELKEVYRIRAEGEEDG